MPGPSAALLRLERIDGHPRQFGEPAVENPPVGQFHAIGRGPGRSRADRRDNEGEEAGGGPSESDCRAVASPSPGRTRKPSTAGAAGDPASGQPRKLSLDAAHAAKQAVWAVALRPCRRLPPPDVLPAEAHEPRSASARGLAWGLAATLLLPMVLAVTLGTAGLLAAVGDERAATVCRWVAVPLGGAWVVAIAATTASCRRRHIWPRRRPAVPRLAASRRRRPGATR